MKAHKTEYRTYNRRGLYAYDMKSCVLSYYQPGFFLVSVFYEEGVILSGLSVLKLLPRAENVVDVYGCISTIKS